MLSWAGKWKEITVRDDQFDFPWLLEIAQFCRKKKTRFRLIDSGKIDASRLEWLAEAGAEFYTSDLARPRAQEIEAINRACIRGGSFTAYFHNNSLEGEPEQESEQEVISFSDLVNMGTSGVYLYFSNRERERNPDTLSELASFCRKGKSWLVYYYHGSPEPFLEELARNGAWIHVSQESLKEEQDITTLQEVLRSGLSSGGGLVLHLGERWKASPVMDLISAGACVLLRSIQSDDRSFSKILQKGTGSKSLDSRCYYLYHEFFL